MEVLERSSCHLGVSGDVQASSTSSLKSDPEKQCVMMTPHHLCARSWQLVVPSFDHPACAHRGL